MKTWTRSLVCLISFSACFFGEIVINLACGPEVDPCDYYPSFFHNTIQANNDYKPFYFNGYQFLNDNQEPADEAGINSAEWAAYMGKGVSARDVETAMYRLSSKVDSALLRNYLKPDKKLPDSLYKNTFFKALVSGHKNCALSYYRFAKSVEPITTVLLEDRWNPKTIAPELQRSKGREALKKATAEIDVFLKLRYYYQAQRLLQYGGDYAGANKIYDSYISLSKSKSHIIGWAASLRAGGELRTGSRSKASFLFSKIFALYPERRVRAYYDFKFIKEEPACIIKYASNGSEKALVYGMQGLYNPRVSTDALEQVYKYYPKSPLLRVLLVREINKIEEQYLSVKLHKTAPGNPYAYLDIVGEDSIAKTQKAYFPVLKKFCKKIADERKCADPGVGNLALAYLSWITDDTDGGLAALSAIKSPKLNRKLADQQQLIKLLLITQKINKQPKLNEAQLVPSLAWLNKKVAEEAKALKSKTRGNYVWGDSYAVRQYSMSARDFYEQVLAPAYIKRKDSAMAGLVILKSQLSYSYDWYYQPRPAGFDLHDFVQRRLHSGHLSKIINWSNSSVKTAIVKQLTAGIHDSTRYNLYDVLGTAYLREHNYKAAVTAFKKMPASLTKRGPSDWDKELHSNPFISRLLDYPKAYTTAIKGYTKLQFAQRMAALQRKINTDPKNAASYYFTMANGLYSTVIDGNGWYYISYTNNSFDKGRKAINYYDDDFLKARNAEKYYLKARSLSKDREFQAKCTFMAAKCRHKQIEFPDYGYPNYTTTQYDRAANIYNAAIRQNTYFKELKQNYRGTFFYKRVANECSYFQDFLTGNMRTKH